jgi:hypothetical protein
MLNTKPHILIIIFYTNLFCECNGFNWYHNINLEDCNQKDVLVLKQFINNSGNSLEMDMDINLNGSIEPIELGWQLWENGRLIHWICQEVPSPYYFYEYDCGLSGQIPQTISNLDELIKLKLQNNNLSGEIPPSICNLKNIDTGSYWFNINNNKLCPPYPDCIESLNQNQNITNCN